ncbi:MAG TPA: IS110 family transposase [Candidatus Acidoferrales bacterium]|nr:IS110 family transposase [Candidatus Acidoferrales bacterium]
MSKREAGKRWYVGIDVSARELVVALSDGGEPTMERVGNDAAGHQQLQSRLRRLPAPVTICLEASGTYSLDVALALARPTAGWQLCLVNPRLARRFAESLGMRSKTDPVDARVLAQYAARMQPAPWQPPSAAGLRLRTITRTIAALVRQCVQHKNRQHALSASAALPALLVRELQAQVAFVDKRIRHLRRQALRLIERQPELLRCWRHLQTIPGVGQASGLAILGELAVLPATLDERQWVAHSGLDPKQHRSGTSVEQKTRISKAGNRYLRAALYMPALVSVQHDPWLGGFYQRLVARGKAKLQALVAVMRKLLHAAWGMFHHDQSYDGAKLCPQP